MHAVAFTAGEIPHPLLLICAFEIETAAIRARMQELEQANKALTEEKVKLSNPAYLEKLAREELGLVKPGEVPYIP